MIDWKKRAPRALPFVNPGAARGILPLTGLPRPAPAVALGPVSAAPATSEGSAWGSRQIRTVRLLASLQAPAQARECVEAALTHWGYDTRRRADVVLVVSELVSDAVRYPLAGHIDVRLD